MTLENVRSPCPVRNGKITGKLNVSDINRLFYLFKRTQESVVTAYNAFWAENENARVTQMSCPVRNACPVHNKKI